MCHFMHLAHVIVLIIKNHWEEEHCSPINIRQINLKYTETNKWFKSLPNLSIYEMFKKTKWIKFAFITTWYKLFRTIESYRLNKFNCLCVQYPYCSHEKSCVCMLVKVHISTWNSKPGCCEVLRHRDLWIYPWWYRLADLYWQNWLNPPFLVPFLFFFFFKGCVFKIFFVYFIYLAALGLSCYMWDILLCMWDLVLWSGIEPRPPASQGKSPDSPFNSPLSYFKCD